jgi:hypothetical protein
VAERKEKERIFRGILNYPPEKQHTPQLVFISVGSLGHKTERRRSAQREISPQHGTEICPQFFSFPAPLDLWTTKKNSRDYWGRNSRRALRLRGDYTLSLLR